jgi:hypothetical protein
VIRRLNKNPILLLFGYVKYHIKRITKYFWRAFIDIDKYTPHTHTHTHIYIYIFMCLCEYCMCFFPFIFYVVGEACQIDTFSQFSPPNIYVHSCNSCYMLKATRSSLFHQSKIYWALNSLVFSSFKLHQPPLTRLFQGQT